MICRQIHTSSGQNRGRQKLRLATVPVALRCNFITSESPIFVAAEGWAGVAAAGPADGVSVLGALQPK